MEDPPDAAKILSAATKIQSSWINILENKYF